MSQGAIRLLLWKKVPAGVTEKPESLKETFGGGKKETPNPVEFDVFQDEMPAFPRGSHPSQFGC